ncbi:hypothetical protein OSB04_008563, partial [Centaurea solstitialis]
MVPIPIDANIIRCQWIFCHKFCAYGTLERYKARLIKGKLTTIRTILSVSMFASSPLSNLKPFIPEMHTI